MPRERLYSVTIPYREPTYEVHRGRSRKKTYLVRYEVVAKTKGAAIERALELFEEDAKNSSVGWVRVPDHKSIRVELL